MSRFSLSDSYQHYIEKFGEDDYCISWVIDYYYNDSRLRYPRRNYRNTNLEGARRFARRWKLDYFKDDNENN